MTKKNVFYLIGIKRITLIVLTTIGIYSQASEVAVYSGTGNLSDQSGPSHPSVLPCGADLDMSPTETDLPSYQFQLFLGGGSSHYHLQKVEKFLGLPFYDYNSHFRTTDGRYGEIQVTTKENGTRLKIWGRIQRSNQDFFAVSETFFECDMSKVGIEKQ